MPAATHRKFVNFQSAFVLVLAIATCASSALGQTTMPNGWQSLDATDFANAAAAVFEAESPASSEHKQEIISHAWKSFLGDEQLASVESIGAILKLTGLLAAGHPDGVTANDIDSMLSRVADRIGSDANSLAGVDLYDLGKAVKGFQPANADGDLDKVGGPALQNPRLFTQWMAANDWAALETHHLYNLFGFVNADSIDRRRFSARWTGRLTPTQTASYSFHQKRVYLGDDSQLKMWIDGNLVLDSVGDNVDAARFTSDLVHLKGGNPVDIRVDLIHNTEKIEYSVSAPMALITWQPEAGEETLISSSSLAPPAGELIMDTNGLLGKYYSDVSFQDLEVSRIDPSLEMVWTWTPTAPSETDSTRLVLAEMVRRLTDDEYLNRIAGESDDVVSIEFDRNLWRIAYRMTVSDRLALVDALRRNPVVLRRLSPEAIGRLYRGIYMLPGRSQLDLIGEWSLARPQPRCQAGTYPEWGNGSYRKLNSDFYFAIGHMMQGPYWSDAEALMEDYLVLEDGKCNLQIAYTLAYATGSESARGDSSKRRAFRSLLQQHLDDETVVGDSRVTWLIATTFTDEIVDARLHPRLLRDRQYLQEALLVADSDDYRFWALQEQVARFCTCDKGQVAEELIGFHRDQFSSPDHQVQMNQWIEKKNELSQNYAMRRSNKQKAARQSYQAELRRRKQLASDGGDLENVSRYEVLLGELE